jgi:hypothetical protein
LMRPDTLDCVSVVSLVFAAVRWMLFWEVETVCADNKREHTETRTQVRIGNMG